GTAHERRGWIVTGTTGDNGGSHGGNADQQRTSSHRVSLTKGCDSVFSLLRDRGGAAPVPNCDSVVLERLIPARRDDGPRKSARGGRFLGWPRKNLCAADSATPMPFSN